jgi:hypothetical protein
MSHTALLGPWVQPRHLQTKSVRAYAEKFSRHPCRLLLVEGFLHAGAADKLSRFLTCEATMRAAHGLYSAQRHSADGTAATSRRAWLAASERDRFYRFSKLSGVPPEHRRGARARAARSFFDALGGPGFKRYCEAVSRLRLGAAELAAYAYRAGDFLRRHSDHFDGRRLAFVIYLSTDWERRFGGELRLWGDGGRSARILPAYNSLLLFDVTAGTQHSVGRISPAAGRRVRVSVSGWLYEPGPGAGSAAARV